MNHVLRQRLLLARRRARTASGARPTDHLPLRRIGKPSRAGAQGKAFDEQDARHIEPIGKHPSTAQRSHPAAQQVFRGALAMCRSLNGLFTDSRALYPHLMHGNSEIPAQRGSHSASARFFTHSKNIKAMQQIS
ncbi:MAG: hypothetical protein N3C59_06890 [Azovibrio sp.]|nr:hypothetical protein [Azovibrio sp.]